MRVARCGTGRTEGLHISVALGLIVEGLRFHVGEGETIARGMGKKHWKRVVRHEHGRSRGVGFLICSQINGRPFRGEFFHLYASCTMPLAKRVERLRPPVSHRWRVVGCCAVCSTMLDLGGTERK